MIFGRQVYPGPHVLVKGGLFWVVSLDHYLSGFQLTLDLGFVLKVIALDDVNLIPLVTIISILLQRVALPTFFRSTVPGMQVLT